MRGSPSGARNRTFSRDAGGGAGDSWAGRASCAAQGQGSLCSRPGEPALCLEPLVTDSLEEGALPWMQKPGWFPRSSPHEQRHRHGCAANSLEKAGGLEGRGEPDKLGWAIQAHLPALNAKLKALDGVVNCSRTLKPLWWECPYLSAPWMNPFLMEVSTAGLPLCTQQCPA